jgi:hypothetical protein
LGGWLLFVGVCMRRMRWGTMEADHPKGTWDIRKNKRRKKNKTRGQGLRR